MSSILRVVLVAAIGFSPVLACGSGVISLAPDGGLGDGGLDSGEGGLPLGQGVGAPCSADLPCRLGLTCESGSCAPGHSSEDGTPCVISDECKAGSYCGPRRTCTPAGPGGAGASCKSDGDCMSGFRCNLVGLGAQCEAEGTHDVGGTCATSAECFGGLACANKTCAPLPPGAIAPLAIPTWKGADCVDDPGPVTAYFRVPRGTGDGDFFRLPFPNDVRRGANGHPSLSGFPTPGPELLGYDVVARYVTYVEQNTDGFSTYPTISLRFSGAIDFASLKASNVVRWVDVTPGAGNDLGYGWVATTGRSGYVCPNSFHIRPPTGGPLVPGHTYAVFITTGATLAGGGAIARAPDLAALLAPSAPSDPALASAYAAYAPLRAWAATKSFDLATILTGSVFTVAHATDPAAKLATAVNAVPIATTTSWTLCGAGPSPCPDTTGARACGTPDPAFDELHALVSLPIFQKGTAPYLTPDDGGDLAYDGSGTPIVQRTEQVCLALTVPKGVAMPAGGWPLAIYAHGTGGSFRSHVTEGVAKALASVDDGAGGTVNIAVLGIDQVEHGPRRGASTATPDDLFFNFANPLAARGNPLQGASDQIALARLARSLLVPAASSPTAADIRFDRIVFWGHSQGATEGGIAAPYADFDGVVFSGQGASLIDALLTKTSPVNIAAALPFVLEDPAGVSASHPVLTLLQNAIDPADPLNHARAIAVAPIAGGTAKHLYMPWGQSDTFTPAAVQSTFILAGGIGLATAAPSVSKPDDIGLSLLTPPVTANIGAAITAVARQYAPPAGTDGHFVVFNEPDAKKDAAHFIADVGAHKTPRVGR